MIEIKKTNNSVLPINFIETDLTGSDFSTLNSTPLTIVPAVANKFIVPIFFLVDYVFNSGSPFQSSGIDICNLNTYNSIGGSVYYHFNATDFASANIGFLTFTVLNPSYNFGITQCNNTSVNSPIVLTALINDATSNNIQSIKFKVGYYLIDQF